MRLLFLLLFIGSNATAQSIFSLRDSAYVKEIELPSQQPFDSSMSYYPANEKYIYIISDKNMYDIFGYNISAKYRQFNFTDFHILGEYKCRQCMEVCNHESGNKNCHRNACMPEWFWIMRDNKKAFTEISSSTVPGHDRKDLPFYNDTIITAKPNTAKWYTTGHGDCHAKFIYTVLADKYYPSLLLREKNYWGGCRAGGSMPATIIFKEPAGIVYKMKRTVLMEKDNEP